MAETKSRKRKRAAGPAPREQADDAERALGRAVALGLPVVALLGAVVVGTMAGLGSAILVLASAALLGAIGLLWASLRTLSGDAPLPSGLEGVAVGRAGVNELVEEKRRVLRALKDIEAEHAIGKIDDKDYGVFVDRYRTDAKELMRRIDADAAPLREEAERIAREYLAKKHVPAAAPSEPEPPEDGRSTCASCDTSNEPDAAFCKKCGASMKSASDAETRNASS
ncbi:MAG TPA: zinc ribbon domain-containing protein [Polyangiaceae bacterium]|jgi:hypothetical protein